MLVSALVTFFSFQLLFQHLAPKWLRRIAGYKWLFDIAMHGTVLWCFFGTSTEGFLQAEAAAILFSLYFRAYAKAFGYEKLKSWRWVRYTGWLTKYTS